jgi:xanthine dehydrogenase accessory factor
MSAGGRERDLFEEIVRLRAEGVPLALATLVQCDGSTPQRPGAKMLVREEGRVAGTLGGGCVEAEVIAVAREVMRGRAARTVSFSLTEAAGGLVCGGSVLVFVEPLAPPPRLVVLGAGHVGRALAQAARFAGFRVTVVDDRPEYADPARVPDAHEVVVGGFGEVFSGLVVGEDSCIVVATRGHKQDFTAVRAALGTPARYIGLVGSRRKRGLLHEHLAAEGFGPEQRDRVVTPAGVPIGAVSPEEIAVSIVAQMIAVRRDHGAATGGPAPRGGGIAEDGGGDAQAAAPARGTAGPPALP